MKRLTPPPSPRRRQLLVAGGAALAVPALAHARSVDPSPWLPYAPHEVMRINPVLRDFELPARRIEPRRTRRSASAAHPGQPPRAYARMGRRHSVAPWLLFGVALQESMLRFGERALPYPWTLCVRGRGLRYGGYAQTLQALRSYVQAGVSNVDCGAMQVNWHWHGDKLGSFERALDPYPNLSVGARILREHYEARGDWRQAVALYHTGSDASASTRARGQRYAGQALDRLARLGVDVEALLRGDGRA